MDLLMDLPAAGTSVPILFLVMIGLLVGGLSGFFGGGASFLLTPLLITIGIPPTVAIGSCANHVVASSASGALGHTRNRTVDYRMAGVLLLGALIGGTLGVRLIRLLEVVGQADLGITLIYVLLLALLGCRMFRDSLRSLRTGPRRRGAGRVGTLRKSRTERLIDALPVPLSFPRSGVRISVFFPLGIGVLVGLVTALTGIGAGFLLVPVLVRTLGLRMPVAVGTVLFTVCLSCVNVTLQHALVNASVDVALALVVFVASVIGAQIGTRMGRLINSDQLRILLAVTVLFATAKLATDVLLPPDVPVTVAEASPRSTLEVTVPESEPARTPPVGDLAVRPEILEFGLFHGPGRIVTTATVPHGDRAVIRLIGPAEHLRLRTKRRLGGVLWGNAGERVLTGVPAVLLIRGWPRQPSEEDLIASELGWRVLARSLLPPDAGPEEQRGFRELIAMKRATGRYRLAAAQGTTADGRARAEFDLPRDAPTGDYRIDIHILGADGVAGRSERRVILRRREAVTAIASLARGRSALYALLAVLLALGVGVSAGLMLGLGARTQSSPRSRFPDTLPT